MNAPKEIKPYTFSVPDALRYFETDASKGLTDAEAEQRLSINGPNSLSAQKPKGIWKMLLEQFTSPVIYLLIGAAVISFSLGDKAEGIAIIIVILVNASIGFFMEWQAHTSMNALKNMDIVTAKVFREGIIKEVPSEKTTTGDIIYLEAGDIVPADSRVVEVRQLQVDESALTGESLPVLKSIGQLEQDTVLAEQVNMLFKGTVVLQGNGKAIITGIGVNTELGKISEMVKTAEQASTPLEKKLQALTKKLILVTVIITIAFFIVGFLKGNALLVMLQTAIAMAVAAIPEGLPIVATIALAYGMLKMAKKNIIVKQLASVETLGSANVILTDKTGTLTQNRISVSTMVTAHGVYNMLKAETGIPESENDMFNKILTIAVLCNDAAIDHEGREVGDPLEVSLLKYVRQTKVSWESIQRMFPREDEEPFNSDTKLMGTLHTMEGGHYVAAKGAAEELLARCSHFYSNGVLKELSSEDKKYWLQKGEELSMEGIRVLGFACRESTERLTGNFIQDLWLVALVGFIDPPQEQVPQAIDECHSAGIKVVMLTGDHPSTALNIARRVHLADQSDTLVINGKDLAEGEGLTADQADAILAAKVFARVTPKQKLDIVTLYQQHGYIAAMTGDGVNDAPALKKADIGIAMGLRGTQIAKETADLVLKDDSFISIVAAVKQGRIIFENIRKCLMYLLSCNLSEILVITVAAFLGVASTLTPLQILYLNLITDVFPALALAVTRGNDMIMKQPPRDTKWGIITGSDWKALVAYALVITACVFAVFCYAYYYLGLDILICNNIVFAGLAFAQLWHVFNLSSAKVSFFKNEITTNPYVWYGLGTCLLIMIATYLILPLRNVLSLEELNGQALGLILIASILPIFFIQLLKRLRWIV